MKQSNPTMPSSSVLPQPVRAETRWRSKPDRDGLADGVMKPLEEFGQGFIGLIVLRGQDGDTPLRENGCLDGMRPRHEDE
jgi:hypothetical protein